MTEAERAGVVGAQETGKDKVEGLQLWGLTGESPEFAKGTESRAGDAIFGDMCSDSFAGFRPPFVAHPFASSRGAQWRLAMLQFHVIKSDPRLVARERREYRAS